MLPYERFLEDATRSDTTLVREDFVDMSADQEQRIQVESFS